MMIPWYYVPIAMICGLLIGFGLMVCYMVASRMGKVSEDVIRRIELEE